MNDNLKQIAITGGKGGTGKSTVSVLFANKLIREGKKVVLCDCDVECPNDYLLLEEELKNEIDQVMVEFPELIKEKCTKCGFCAETCQSNAIFQPKGKYPIFMNDLCSACGACMIVCPNNAIKAKKEKVGKIYENEISDDFNLISGLSKPGFEETSVVVRKLKNIAIKIAKEKEADVILFDTAAGTHCSVISALMGVDKAYAVTEPTPLGAYDLDLILELCRKLGIDTEVILNQSDMGKENIIQPILEKYSLKLRTKIPYSKKLVESYSKGKLKEFNELNEKIKL